MLDEIFLFFVLSKDNNYNNNNKRNTIPINMRQDSSRLMIYHEIMSAAVPWSGWLAGSESVSV